jgi:hypothetical protein
LKRRFGLRRATSLLCRLLGIRNTDDLRSHPLRGAIFENLVIAERRLWECKLGSTLAQEFFKHLEFFGASTGIPSE